MCSSPGADPGRDLQLSELRTVLTSHAGEVERLKNQYIEETKKVSELEAKLQEERRGRRKLALLRRRGSSFPTHLKPCLPMPSRATTGLSGTGANNSGEISGPCQGRSRGQTKAVDN